MSDFPRLAPALSYWFSRCPVGTNGVQLNKDLKSIVAGVGRFFVFCMLAALPVLVLRRDVLWLGNSLGEQSLVEFTQAGFLLATSVSFMALAALRQEDRRFGVLAATFFAVMLVREQDALLDTLIAHGSWKYIATPMALLALLWAAGNVRETLSGLARFLASRAGTVMLLGLALLLCYSRLLGMTEIWTTVLGDGYARIAKNSVEETTELLGYGFILAASIKYVAQRVRAVARDPRSQTAPVRQAL